MERIRGVLSAPASIADRIGALRAATGQFEEAFGAFLNEAGGSFDVDEIVFWGLQLRDALAAGPPRAALDEAERARLGELADRALVLSGEMNFGFLYDAQRGLFTIGYRLADAEGPGRSDPSYYDLLASEARLASFLAIAKGDVPQAHWFHLGRALVSVRGSPTLVSWSASTFEYLMPLLLTRSYDGTLLDQSCRNAVRMQIRYARIRGVPWGISESAFALVDRQGHYQYKAFGIPGLGLKRGLGDDLVISPYSTVLALQVEPEPSLKNLRRLRKEGLEGRYGMYEAIDYSPKTYGAGEVEPPSPDERKGVIVTAFLAHHHGMSLLALDNVLLNGAMQRRFHADPRVQATEVLLQERLTRSVSIMRPRPIEARPTTSPAIPSSVRRFRTPHTPYPQAHFLSNGNYTLVVTNAGGGASICRGRAVTRWREDRTRDLGSQYVYLRDVRSGLVWSAAYQPTRREPEEYAVTFQIDRASFRRLDDGIETQLEIVVSPEDDVEVRRLSIVNRSDQVREIEATSYVELALASIADDLAHPVFRKLFVGTEYLPASAALLCCQSESGEQELHVHARRRGAHAGIECETDCAKFIGRGRELDDLIAPSGRPLLTTLVLDRIAS